MDFNKYSAIAHRDHIFSNPINSEKMNTIIDRIPLQPDHQVIDIGAGMCELPIRLIEKYQVSATAVELYDDALREGRKRAEGRIPIGNLNFVNEDAKVAIERYSDPQFKLGICVGATHAIGDFTSTLQALKKCVRKGGYILIGEGYWKQPPDQGYLDALGAEESEFKSHYENLQTAEDLGLTPLWAYTASEDDWDHYEWLYAMSIENYCFENPDDPDCEEMLEKIRSWKKTYNKWGRETLGFGLYLFRT